MVGKYLAGSVPSAEKVGLISTALGVPVDEVSAVLAEGGGETMVAEENPPHLPGPDVPNRNNPERAAEPVETYRRERDPGLANRPLISDMFADSETRRPTKLEEQGLARIGGSVVAEGHDRDGIMYAVEVVFHVRLEPTVTTHKQTVTQGPSAGARP